jgi:hypothetical protein
METLLDKVKKVEEEVSERLSGIEKAGKTQLADLLSTEKEVAEAVRAKAEAEKTEIVKEYVRKAHAETNAMKQDREKSLASIKESAENNRAGAVEKVMDLLKETYLS